MVHRTPCFPVRPCPQPAASHPPRCSNWLSGRAPHAPAGLADKTRLPAGHWTGERAATDVLALAAKGRAFKSLDTLNIRQGGRHLLYGSALALAATLQSWAQLTGASVPSLANTEIR